MFQSIERELLQLTEKVGGICFLGGITINTPDECEEYFLPLRFEVRNPRMETHGLLNKLRDQMKRSGDLKYPEKTDIELNGDAWRHTFKDKEDSLDCKMAATDSGNQTRIEGKEQGAWEEHVDEATGKPYYYNKQTGETSWKEEH